VAAEARAPGKMPAMPASQAAVVTNQ